MIILGVDTAIRCTGYGVISIESPERFEILDCGLIKNKQSAPHSECLRRLYGGIDQLCSRFRPHAAAIEAAFYQKNISTAMILSIARGAIMAALVNNGVDMFAYEPRRAKKAVVGTGAASKEQVASMIAAMSNLDISNIPQDATDALSIAVCHGQIAVKPQLQYLLPRPL
ncbi:MAG: crossover junction endodeoxyribonuclease RuvC [Victivallales bacterium]|nr:crossover junction endodeoxyribonuclease RuvC [Victivallales bacterium]